mgnify:CR=1 FL=1
MTYRINYAKVISQAGSIEKGALELAAQVRALEQYGKAKRQMCLSENCTL